ncbi:MAG: flagellar export chaperone FliS [Clostridiales bacterium]|nr:flagellar export chaperone FliS [Clostridiales bacterium]
MAIYNPYKQYENQNVMTASAGELVLMLYNGFLRFLRQAIEYIQGNEIEKAHNSILRAQAIIEELMFTLDADYEISKSMEQLYDYMGGRLVDANISKDIETLNEIIDLMVDLRDTWAEAIKINRQQRYANEG